MEAARYPDDFDGIVSGCPVASKTGIYATFINYMQIFPDPEKPLLTEADLQRFQKQVLDQCDENDGLRDGIVNDPTTCRLNWSQIAGFSDKQVEALKSVYGGPKVDEECLYPGLPIGSESRWYHWFIGPDFNGLSRSTSLGLACSQFCRYLVFDDPEWSPIGYDLVNWRHDTRQLSEIVDCADADLQPFHASDGKLIIWHGWSDGALSANASIEFFDSITAPNKHQFVKLYLLPGVYHCGSGPGPSEIDWLDVVSDWVEHDHAPDRLVVSKRDAAGNVVMTRPICPYPKTVRYRGGGNPNRAQNFVVVE
jgi:feruloyl esterase